MAGYAFPLYQSGEAIEVNLKEKHMNLQIITDWTVINIHNGG